MSRGAVLFCAMRQVIASPLLKSPLPELPQKQPMRLHERLLGALEIAESPYQQKIHEKMQQQQQQEQEQEQPQQKQQPKHRRLSQGMSPIGKNYTQAVSTGELCVCCVCLRAIIPCLRHKVKVAVPGPPKRIQTTTRIFMASQSPVYRISPQKLWTTNL